MIVQRVPDLVTDWFIVFNRDCATQWLARLLPGRWKHVWALGFSHACRTWVAYDVNLSGTTIVVLPECADSHAKMAIWLADADVLRFQGRPSTLWKNRLGFFCTPAIRHLVGSRCGALTPAGFYYGLIAEGAQVFHGAEALHVRQSHAADGDARRA